MAINIKNDEAESLARLVAKEANETITEAITQALRDRLVRLRARGRARERTEQLEELVDSFAKLPTLDARSADEILGYDEDGLP